MEKASEKAGGSTRGATINTIYGTTSACTSRVSSPSDAGLHSWPTMPSLPNVVVHLDAIPGANAVPFVREPGSMNTVERSRLISKMKLPLHSCAVLEPVREEEEQQHDSLSDITPDTLSLLQAKLAVGSRKRIIKQYCKLLCIAILFLLSTSCIVVLVCVFALKEN